MKGTRLHDIRYRCHAGDARWHWNPACGSWPTLVYAAERAIPVGGAACAECLARSERLAA